MNVFAKFDEIPSMILQDIKETKRYGHTVGRSDNVKTVYPPTNTVCGGYNQMYLIIFFFAKKITFEGKRKHKNIKYGNRYTKILHK